MKGQPRRKWDAARAKVEAEGYCRACASPYGLQAAHILGREHDKKSGYRVLPERVVPLCGPVVGDEGCHARYDRHAQDIWHILNFEEQAQAIEDAGGYWLAVKRCSPVAYRESLGGIAVLRKDCCGGNSPPCIEAGWCLFNDVPLEHTA
jgi:hypothetical protein